MYCIYLLFWPKHVKKKKKKKKVIKTSGNLAACEKWTRVSFKLSNLPCHCSTYELSGNTENLVRKELFNPFDKKKKTSGPLSVPGTFGSNMTRANSYESNSHYPFKIYETSTTVLSRESLYCPHEDGSHYSEQLHSYNDVETNLMPYTCILMLAIVLGICNTQHEYVQIFQCRVQWIFLDWP